jgi:hypothetical protein
MKTRAYSSLLAATVATIGSFALAAPAQATSAHGCSWPRVCFYLTQNAWVDARPDASYKDMYYQTLGQRSRNADYIYNSRNDDGALIYWTNDLGGAGTFCLRPNESVHTVPLDEHVYAIEIKDSPICAY